MTHQDVLAAIGIAAAISITGSAQPRGDGDALYRVLPRDAIPAIDDPRFESVADADAKFADDELVIGLVGDGQQRAYSTWQLDQHEIVNDVFEGQPVAVTWCPLCGTAVVYARRVGAETLTFGVSGMLFRDALVMFDRETDTLWTHVDGRAIQGALQGQELTPLPSVHTTWAAWKRLYPNSGVLTKRGRMRSHYESYNRSRNSLGILGRRNEDRRLPGKERILAVRTDRSAIAFPVRAVREARLVQETVDQRAVLLLAPAGEYPVMGYERAVDGQILTFELIDGEPPVVRDLETGTRWRVADGSAIDGPLAGRVLRRLTVHPAFWFGWRGYFPHSAVWTAEGIQ